MLRKEIDMKYANFFLRTEIPFRLADSDALKELFIAINPEYARSTPSAKTLAGALLSKSATSLRRKMDADQAFFMAYAKQSQIALQKNPSIAGKLDEEINDFIYKMSTFPLSLKKATSKLSARTYWLTIGSCEFPTLDTIAKPIVEIIFSSSASERSCSTVSF